MLMSIHERSAAPTISEARLELAKGYVNRALKIMDIANQWAENFKLSKMPENHRNAIADRCTKLFDCIVRLPPNQFDSENLLLEKFEPGEFSSIKEEEAVYILERYQEVLNLDFAKEFGVTDSQLLLLLMYGVWEEAGNFSFDFTPICSILEIKYSSYNMFKQYVCDEPESKKEISLQRAVLYTFVSPKILSVLTIMCIREAKLFEMKVEWPAETVYSDEEIKAVTSYMAGIIPEAACNFMKKFDMNYKKEEPTWKGLTFPFDPSDKHLFPNPEDPDSCQVLNNENQNGDNGVSTADDDVLVEVHAEDGTLMAEFQEECLAQEEKLRVYDSLPEEEATDRVIRDMEAECDEMEKSAVIIRENEAEGEGSDDDEEDDYYDEKRYEELVAEVEKLSEQIEYLQKCANLEPTTLASRLALLDNQLCLARRPDGETFSEARFVRMADSSTCVVRFVELVKEDGSEALGPEKFLDIGDIGHTMFHIYDDELYTTRYSGVRVVALAQPPGATEAAWYAGTISYFPNVLHDYDFLVFFDAGFERYVPGITSIDHEVAIAAEKIPSTTFANMKKKMELLKIFPLCRQSLTPNLESEIDKAHVWTLMQNAKESQIRFIQHFFSTFPSWPMLRAKNPQPGQIPQITIVNNGADERLKVFIVKVDRSMCVVRLPPEESQSEGIHCFDYPCDNEKHQHYDEWMFRGSLSFDLNRRQLVESEQQPIANNMSTSARRGRRGRTVVAPPLKDVTVVEIEDEDERLPDDGERRRTARKSTGANCQPTRRSEVPRIAKEKENIFEIAEHDPANRIKKKIYPFHEECSEACLGESALTDDSPLWASMSPLMVPLMCYWTRMLYQYRNYQASKKKLEVYVIYRSPCGRSFQSMTALAEYLNRFPSGKLAVDMFNFDPDINPSSYVKVPEKHIVCKDFSRGLELRPIRAVNSVDDEGPPAVTYCINRFPAVEEVNVSTVASEFCSGCSCEGDCSDASRCECQKLTRANVMRLAGSFRPSNYGYDHRSLVHKTISGIFECNANCSCNTKKCYNRVVQNKPAYPLQLFKTAMCGWGVRAVCDIPRGTFITNYVGALMSDEIAEKAQFEDDRYFADLDLNDVVEQEKTSALAADGHLEWGDVDSRDSDAGSCSSGEMEVPVAIKRRRMTRKSGGGGVGRKRAAGSMYKYNQSDPIFKWEEYFGERHALYVLDARECGNIGRFLNHSCDPNVIVQNVLVDTHDLRLPWMSFFALKNIKAGEELCWDYSYSSRYDPDYPEELQMPCYCGAVNCCGRLM